MLFLITLCDSAKIITAVCAWSFCDWKVLQFRKICSLSFAKFLFALVLMSWTDSGSFILRQTSLRISRSYIGWRSFWFSQELVKDCIGDLYSFCCIRVNHRKEVKQERKRYILSNWVVCATTASNNFRNDDCLWWRCHPGIVTDRRQGVLFVIQSGSHWAVIIKLARCDYRSIIPVSPFPFFLPFPLPPSPLWRWIINFT